MREQRARVRPHPPVPGWLAARPGGLAARRWVFAGVTVLLVLGTARRSPRRWPLWAGLAGALLTVLGSWVYPLVVEPLFNEFTSLPARHAAHRILALAGRRRCPVSDVLVADASRRTTTLNAYVSGFGSTRRVVLYDNLVEDVPRARDADRRGARARPRPAPRRPARHRAGRRRGGPRQRPARAAALASQAAGPGRRRGSRASPRRWRCCSPWPRSARCWPARCRTRSAGRSRRVRTGPRSRRPGTTSAFERMQEQLAARSLSDPDPPWLSQFWFGSHPTTLQRWAWPARCEQRSADAAAGRAAGKQERPVPSPCGVGTGRGATAAHHPPAVQVRCSARPLRSRRIPALVVTQVSSQGVYGLRSVIVLDRAGVRPSRRCRRTGPPPRLRRGTRRRRSRAAMPATSRPYSTADAPSSSRARSVDLGRTCRPLTWCSPKCAWRDEKSRDPVKLGSQLHRVASWIRTQPPEAAAPLAGDGGAGVVEDVADHAAEEEDDGDDQGGDAGDQQAVLHGGGAVSRRGGRGCWAEMRRFRAWVFLPSGN